MAASRRSALDRAPATWRNESTEGRDRSPCTDWEDCVKPSTKEVTTIDEYIRGFPADVQAILSELRSTIRSAAPDRKSVV